MALKIAIIIPAFNEQETIAKVVSEIIALNNSGNYQFDAIVINDCSTDNTPMIAEKLNCVLLDLPVNLGIGGAVQTGFKYALENNYDYAIQVDGDGQHPTSAIPKLLDKIINSNSDIVIGSRFIENTGFQSFYMRRVGIKFFRFLLKLLCGIKISDPTSGFRIINRKTLNIVNEYYPDEYPEPEALVIYKYYNLKISETPVQMEERKGGISSIKGLLKLYYMFKVSLAIFFTFIKLKFNLWKISYL